MTGSLVFFSMLFLFVRCLLNFDSSSRGQEWGVHQSMQIGAGADFQKW